MPTDEESLIYIWERGLGMTNKFTIHILLVLLIVLTGCGIKVVPHITSPIDSYAVFMSSVPGYPLEVELDIKGREPDEIVIKFKTNNGVFLEWGDDMKVRNFGKAIDHTEGIVYWSPFKDGTDIAKSAKITVTISYMGTVGRVTIVTVKNIYSDKDGMYSFKSN